MGSLVKYISSFLFSLAFVYSEAQQAVPKDSPIKLPVQIDTMTSEFRQRIERYRQGRIGIRQQNLLDEIRATINRAESYQKTAINSEQISNVISRTRDNLRIVNDGLFDDNKRIPSHQNLAVSGSVLIELLEGMELQQNIVSTYAKNLVDYRVRIDSLASDSALLIIPDDSASLKKYMQKIEVIGKEFGPADTSLTKSINSVLDLQNEIDIIVFSIRSSLEEIDAKQKELTSRVLSREFPNLTASEKSDLSMGNVIKTSIEKNFLALGFYLKQGSTRLLLLILLITFGTYFLRSLKKKVVEGQGLDPAFHGQLVLRYPVLSAFLIVTSLYQFSFLSPPFIFSFCLWLLQVIAVTFIFNGFISTVWMRYWIVMSVLFVLASLDNLILQASLTERWILQSLAFVGFAYGLYALIWKRKNEIKERGILYFTGFFVATQFVAIILNGLGRYNLGKTFLTGGYAGFVIAIIFLWTVRLINEAMALASKTYRHADRKSFYINFERVGQRAPMLFYILLVVGWCLLVGRNFYGFRQLADPFNNFLAAGRKLGSFSFSFQSLLVFFVIMFCAVLLSRLISYIASDPVETVNKDSGQPKASLGSWLLLIRIIIISLGLFFAFAATGIPLDRLTIVLGALSVGIGLGLQGMVTNLVSGLIIAFEKPVNVGDIIEIDKKQGTMKSIGFRSSTINMIDGSTIVIPNGDLLKGPLVNWTLGKRARRYDFTVSVALGTDLLKVQQLLNDIISKNRDIRHYPAPIVIAKDFIENSIQFQIFFWADILKDSGIIKGEIIEEIDAAFRANGIVIPNIRVNSEAIVSAHKK